ncbi:hypothetical protein ABIF14_001943 [Bradyrhizobium elkanii]
MNAPVRADDVPRLEDFPYRLSDNVRFADLDPNGHVNNAVYASYFETGRVTLVKDRSMGLMPAGLGWIMVRASTSISAPSCTGRVRSSSGSVSSSLDAHRPPSTRWCFRKAGAWRRRRRSR